MSKGRAQAIFKLSVGCWSWAAAQVGTGRTSPGGSVGALALPGLPRQQGHCGPRLSISSHWLGSHQDSPKRSVSGRFYHSDVQAYDLHEGHCIICVTLPPRARNPSEGTPFPPVLSSFLRGTSPCAHSTACSLPRLLYYQIELKNSQINPLR